MHGTLLGMAFLVNAPALKEKYILKRVKSKE